MKMIKDGKLFGKINLFDAVILFLIIILIIAGITKFSTFNQAVDANSAGKITYQFIINNVRDYTANAFQSGDSVFDSQTGINIGTIRKVQIQDAGTIKSLASGKTVVAENPYRRDVVLTIETPGSSTENGFFANKSIELKVGSEKNIETLYATTYGKVKSINYYEE